MKRTILYIENRFYSSSLIKDLNGKPKKYKYIDDILTDLKRFFKGCEDE